MKQLIKLHSPTLDTVQMVEDTIQKAKEVIKIAELKRRLPRKVNHNTLKVILAYLQKSGKVEFTPSGVVGIATPKEDIEEVLHRGRSYEKKTGHKKMFTKEEIIEKIETNRTYIKSLGVKKLTLIGSYARGESTEKSDIDLLVEFEDGRGLYDDYMQLLHFLQDLFGKDIDLVEASLLREELKSHILGGAKIEARI